jgi:biotin carboxyl carrier protein
MAAVMVGKHKLSWKTPPRNTEGSGELEMENGTKLPVSWKVDSNGVWVTFPHGSFGYDIKAEADDTEVQYSICRRRGLGEWSAAKVDRGTGGEVGKNSSKNKTLKVKAQMPGKIIRVFAKAGQSLEKGDPILVMEAMKMENEMKAAETGTLVEIKVKEGQAVETGIELYTIEPKK